ncbi:MAG: CinA family protein [Candidatus Moduliflexus flocculans]|nr:CinA family protein [Candidatus Moduliflexus flocculans]
MTGIAGPGGGTARKPVGLVYIALARAGGGSTVERRTLLRRPGQRSSSSLRRRPSTS